MTQWIAKGTGASEFYTLVPENPWGGPFDFLGGGGVGGGRIGLRKNFFPSLASGFLLP